MVDRTTLDVDTKYLTLTVTTAAATTSQTTAFNLGQRKLQVLDIFWPRGANGLVGVRIEFASVAILPWGQASSFVVGNNERRIFDMGIQTIGGVNVVTQNNDPAFAHKVVITAACVELNMSDVQNTPLEIIPLTDL